jgi:hypothetical protein
MHVGSRSWRDTGVMWLALAGVDVAKMQRRAGHDHITTTIGYVKVGRGRDRRDRRTGPAAALVPRLAGAR